MFSNEAVEAKLKTLKDAKPFMPFYVVTNDGGRFLAHERFSFGFNDRMMIIAPKDSVSERIRFSQIDHFEEYTLVSTKA